MPASEDYEPLIPRPKLPLPGEMPERDTPEAIVHLIRLANANPILDHEPIRPRLLALAAVLNDKLPPAQRVSPDDPRLNEPIMGEGRALAEHSVASIGKYIMNPAIRSPLEARANAFLVLSRYFVWCRGL